MPPTAERIAALPLLYVTPASWADDVLREPLRLLNDHAWLEKKAAGNALELLNRWPEPSPPENWVTAMTAIARDEVEHLAIVVRLLARMGGRLTRSHDNPYAAALRGLVRTGRGPEELIDRLMISALIEARSCERFTLLAGACTDAKIARVYRTLAKSEEGHYLVFLDLTRQLPSRPKVDRRWREMLEAEAKIIAAQPVRPTMHSGCSRVALPPSTPLPLA